MLLKTVVFTALAVIVTAEEVRYDNYALFKVLPNSEEHVDFLNDLYKSNEGYNFWKPPSVVGEYVSVVAPPILRKEFEHSLSKRSIYSELMLENIQEAFDAQSFSRRKRDASRQLFWTNYQTLEDIYDWFEHLADTHSNIVTLITVGQTHEGRNITGIRISKRSGRPAFYLQGGEVGADWLSPTILTYIVDQLIQSDDAEVRAASENYEWHIFPVVNPDGFEFSQDSVRLWVKNRRPISSTAIGVDLTKNWNSQWGVRGGNFTAEANNYIGLGPFSELETRLVSSHIESIGSRLIGFLSFRSFGQRLIIPFAHTTSPMYNYNEMVMIGRRAMGSLAVRYGTQYVVGNSGLVHDGATGAAEDWAKFRFNPPIAASYLLRDTGNWGYALPVNQILPSCEETLDSLVAIIREARFINVL